MPATAALATPVFATAAEAISHNLPIAAEALAALQLGSSLPALDPAGLTAIAPMFGGDIGAAWVAILQGRGQLDGFVTALESRGLVIGTAPPAIMALPGTAPPITMNLAAMESFARRANGCLVEIYRDNAAAGSGLLIGPSTVLTAWHVIALPPAQRGGQRLPTIEIALADGRRISAFMPPLVWQPCTTLEDDGELPGTDTDLFEHGDYAALRLASPVGALLGTASLPDTAPPLLDQDILLLHYPNGADRGAGWGRTARLGALTSRWAHSARTLPGSSGGGCFDSAQRLVGLHQGRHPDLGGRLVPVACFRDQLAAVLANDIAPARMWSLDGTPEGDFVIGRQRFFDAFAAARRDGPVRGIRTKRIDPTADLSGLSFTCRMLESMIAREQTTRLCRISFEALVGDLATEIARRVSDAGIAIARVEAVGGVANGQSAPEAVGADRGRRVALAIERAAAAREIQLWLFIDHPAVAFGDEIRAALEGFVDQALKLPHIRLVLAGYEAVAMPGLEFATVNQAPGASASPGLVSDYISNFAASDVEALLNDTAASIGRVLGPDERVDLVTDALAGLAHINGTYAPWLAAEVGKRLRAPIRRWFSRAERP